MAVGVEVGIWVAVADGLGVKVRVGWGVGMTVPQEVSGKTAHASSRESVKLIIFNFEFENFIDMVGGYFTTSRVNFDMRG